MRVLALHTDSYGGYGGIAAMNRRLLRVLGTMEDTEEVVALPRLVDGDERDGIPENVTFRSDSAGGRATYIGTLLCLLLTDRAFDVIWCGHLHLVPVAMLAKQMTGAPVVLHIHGVEAWTPTGRPLVDWLVSHVDHFLSVSEITKSRFVDWSGVSLDRGIVIPNTIDFSELSPGPKPPELLERYDLHDQYVLMTMGRLVGRERRKGFDRVLEVLPDVARERPNVAYLIVGRGPDRSRLEQKARRLGVRDRVVFTGYITDGEKAGHFRLTDRFVMPSEGEGFGLVLLEALACGTPVVGSAIDGGREALANGKFGTLVDPRNPDEVKDALLDEASPPTPAVVQERFGVERYRGQIEEAVQQIHSSQQGA